MNFFRKLRRPKISLSISDDTHDKENGSSKGRPLSSNLRRSGGLTNSENYHTAETKLFEVRYWIYTNFKISFVSIVL